MTDEYYRRRSVQRDRPIWIIIGLLVSIGVGYVAYQGFFLDSITGTYATDPRSVIESYIDAIKRGDLSRAQLCWQHDAYYEIGAGCSEICLQRIMGTALEIRNISMADTPELDRERHRLIAIVTVGCPDGEVEYSGSILVLAGIPILAE